MKLSYFVSLLCVSPSLIHANLIKRAVPHGLVLRILPLGDSITSGFQSTSSNGYRLDLLNTLRQNKNVVTYVGDLGGTFPGDHHEGLSGEKINQISSASANSLEQRPNVVLLHAGTNDMGAAFDVGNAPARLGALIDKIFFTCPDTTILVAKIIKTKFSTDITSRIKVFNGFVEAMVNERRTNGQHIVLVDMFDALVRADLFDDLHPNDIGYRKMAAKWADGIADAASNGWINDPVQLRQNGVGHQTCTHTPDWSYKNQIANGAGLGQNYFPAIQCSATNPEQPDTLVQVGATTCYCNVDGRTEKRQRISSSCEDDGTYATTAVRLADLNADGRAEWLHVSATGRVIAYLNGAAADGGVNWIPQKEIASGVGGRRHQIQFADIDGDGRAEYLWVHDDGSVSAWQNIRNPAGGLKAATPIWNHIPEKIATGFGKDGAGVRFADLNGDGRAEYIWISETGEIRAFLNLGAPTGKNPVQVNWYHDYQIADFELPNQRDSVVFTDLNGDGRADFVYVSRADGSYTYYVNEGGPDGLQAAQVAWRQQVGAVGSLLTGTPASADGNGVQFADLDGDGRAEYLNVDGMDSATYMWHNGCEAVG